LDQNTFDRLRESVLVPAANKIIKAWPGVILKTEWESRVQDQYEEARRFMRAEMMRMDKDEANLRIDRHKVGAACAWSILRALPFTYSGNLVGGRFANEEMAFHCAIACVVSWGLSEATKRGNNELAARYRKPFKIPTSSDGPYLEHFHKMLYQMRPESMPNLFLLSNLLFVLEQYHLAVTP
jgi:hypothetical protein